MSQLAELKSQLSLLPLADRAELASYLLHTLDDEDTSSNEEPLLAELHRRAAAINDGTAAGRPADEVFADLRRKFS